MPRGDDVVESRTSPDGGVRLDIVMMPVDIGSRMPALRITRTDTQEVLALLHAVSGIESCRAGSPGTVTLDLQCYGRNQEVWLDWQARSFRLHPDDDPRALAVLPEALARVPPRAAPRTRPRWRQIATGFLNVLVCVLLLTGSLLLLGQPWKRAWAGLLGVPLFGFATFLCLAELVRTLRGQQKPAREDR